MTKEEIESYFYAETQGMEISNISLVDTRTHYLWIVNCYQIKTKQGHDYYVFDGDELPTNIYPVYSNMSLDMYYHMHIGLVCELCSRSVEKNFIINFIEKYSVFPVLDRRLLEIGNDIMKNENNASQLSGIANQIRDCYIILSHYLMNKNRSENPSYKDDNFKDNLCEFLNIILPGEQSEKRRNTINSIAQKGWGFTAELVHKESVTVFDIMTALNILELTISMVSNVIVGNHIPINKTKCPNCLGENYTMTFSREKIDYEYRCVDCGYTFSVPLDDMKKEIQ